MSFAAIRFPEYPRAEIRAGIAAQSNAPDWAIDQIVDIACHAAASGRRTMLETVDRASDHRVAHTALGIAVSLLKSDADNLIKSLQKYAAETGHEASEFVVGGAA
jgi:hypothetical protein